MPRLAIERRYCKTVGKRHKEFRNLIRSRRRFHAQPLRGGPTAESRVYENSDSLLAFPAFFPHWDRKSVQPICHALRERTYNCCTIVDCYSIVTPLDNLL